MPDSYYKCCYNLAISSYVSFGHLDVNIKFINPKSPLQYNFGLVLMIFAGSLSIKSFVE